MRRRAVAVVAAVCVAMGLLGACGSDDNGGVIDVPQDSSTSLAPGTTAGGSTTPGY